jgi:OOP family OmpA-OmpF porin
MTSLRPSAALFLALTLTVTGCAGLQKRWNKPWGKGALYSGLVGAIAGGTALGVAANNQAFSDMPDDAERAWAITAGIGGGALVGALVGHMLFDAPAPVVASAPPPPPPEPPKPMLVLKGTNFAFNSAELKPDAIAALGKTLESLKENPDLRITVNGYTDSIGPEAYNQQLSERRANSVKRFLVSEGIAADRIETQGFGESNPVADNDTDAGRAENRRVEVHKLR